MGRPIYEIKAEFFRTLGHPARIRVLELLSDGEPKSVGELAPDVGIEPSHLSQQLSIMRRAGIVESRREGTSVFYSPVDPQILELLAVAKQILITKYESSQDLLDDLDTMEFEPASD